MAPMSGTIKNVASRYVHHGSNVYSCLLDASKAFDLVRHDILFDRLLQRDLPPLIVSFLLGWYTGKNANHIAVTLFSVNSHALQTNRREPPNQLHFWLMSQTVDTLANIRWMHN